LRNCNDYLRVKGDKQEVIYLTEIKRQTERALSDARQYATKNAEAAQPWIASHEELLSGVDAALAVESHPAVQNGALVQPSNMVSVIPRS
jgi:hypothetical protein